MCETLSYLAVNQAVFYCYKKFTKIIIKEKTLVLITASNTKMYYLNSCKRDLVPFLGNYNYLN